MLSSTSARGGHSTKAPSAIEERLEMKEEDLVTVVDMFGSDDEIQSVESSEGASQCRSSGIELGTAIEQASYQFVVLASGAMNTFDEEYGRLMGKSVGLHDRLADSKEKASNLEDMLQREQGRRVAFEVKAENLRASQRVMEVEML
ncbi:hypothetical protein GUJ93_ZPchr0008g12402 [Zizania palustris]|uniref:Uncharacterized protein n=1 Tax=Zizania palustris TaxID=103762 RepID=A0A8J5RD69_ZIZPA|nr:hypothetical protein GUJ93_ZPchr0008g12402 [Zizania palustris]